MKFRAGSKAILHPLYVRDTANTVTSATSKWDNLKCFLLEKSKPL